MSKIVKIAALAVLTSSVLVAAPPPAVRTAQITTSPDEGALEAAEQRLKLLDFAPVWTHEVNGSTHLLVGKCERHVDAVLVRNSLREHGYPDAFTKAFKEIVTGDFETEAVTPDPPLVVPAVTPQENLFRSVTYMNDQRVLEMIGALRGGTDPATIVTTCTRHAAFSDGD